MIMILRRAVSIDETAPFLFNLANFIQPTTLRLMISLLAKWPFMELDGMDQSNTFCIFSGAKSFFLKTIYLYFSRLTADTNKFHQIVFMEFQRKSVYVLSFPSSRGWKRYFF